MEDLIHETMEDSRGIAEPEGHYYMFEMSIVRLECCLSLVTLLYVDQVVPHKSDLVKKIMASFRRSKKSRMRGKG